MGKKKGKSKGSKQTGSSELLRETAGFSSPNIDVITAAIGAANQAVFLKVCRLCESKDGPFLNIFDSDKVTAKKIDELMPFGIAENDDLPHKICFRCSAKVEELYEFIQKCINTQHSLRKAMGKSEPLATKPKTRVLWEEKLNKSNMSNDDICDALIKKAMEGIKDIPLSPPLPKEDKPPVVQKKESKPAPAPKKETKSVVQNNKNSEKSDDTIESSDSDLKYIPTRVSRSKNAAENLLDGLQDVKRRKLPSKQNDTRPKEDVTPVRSSFINNLSFDYEEPEPEPEPEPIKKPEPKPKPVVKEKTPDPPPKPFNIMDHISMIKVNSVGVLFQCKLCNRNFLKKELVMVHGCAKNGGVPKLDFTKTVVPPAPPKAPVVKYINTKIDNEPYKPIEKKSDTNQEVEVKKAPVETKPKPKVGPASKVKKDENYQSVIGMTVIPMEMTTPASKSAVPSPAPPTNNQVAPPPPSLQFPASSGPSVQFPALPSLNSRYKLVPGPNNTFQLVEETEPEEVSKPEEVVEVPVSETKSRKRKSDPSKTTESTTRKQNTAVKRQLTEVIDLDEPTKPTNAGGQPYPVGLFQTLPHHSGIFTPSVPEPPFTTPAMKKQSYTIVQTGNPSKLLISTKPQLPPEELPKKKSKKSKPEAKPKSGDKNPFNVTIEDATPAKDPGFFTFINVDPLLQPSYVLPTDTIIQESQISTSTPVSKGASKVPVDNKESKYTCNMCSETFSREKKLLTHIQSHYNKMDEEDEMRKGTGNSKKRTGRKH